MGDKFTSLTYTCDIGCCILLTTGVSDSREVPAHLQLEKREWMWCGEVGRPPCICSCRGSVSGCGRWRRQPRCPVTCPPASTPYCARSRQKTNRFH